MLQEHLQLETYEELLCALGADMRYVSPRYIGPDKFKEKEFALTTPK
jgi:hypothetical protein